MILILIGQTASGKTTIRDQLVEEGLFRPIITYTTRPKRSGEVDGVDYRFVTEDEFDAMFKMGMFAETTEYNAAFGYCRYGSLIDDYRYGFNSVVILNPDGVKQLKMLEEEGEIHNRIFVLMLDVDQETLVKRALARGDKPEEINRRIIADEEKFISIGKYIDCKLTWSDEQTVYEAVKRLIKI